MSFQNFKISEKSSFDLVVFEEPHGVLSWLIVDKQTKKAVLIDPTHEAPTEYYDYLKENSQIELEYVFDTHTHADHISLGKEMREKLGVKYLMHEKSPTKFKDIAAVDGQIIKIGGTEIKVLYTPGHTNESISFEVNDGGKYILFTGDTMFIDSCGRTDFQLGNSQEQYESLIKLSKYADDTVICPGHDYQDRLSTTLGEAKQNNERLVMAIESKQKFVDFMNSLHPPLPDLFDISVPANSK